MFPVQEDDIMLRWLILLVSRVGMLGLGFVLGIYALPILTAPEGPDKACLLYTSPSPRD